MKCALNYNINKRSMEDEVRFTINIMKTTNCLPLKYSDSFCDCVTQKDMFYLSIQGSSGLKIEHFI